VDSDYCFLGRHYLPDSDFIPTHARELRAGDKGDCNAFNRPLCATMNDKAFTLIFWLPVGLCLLVGFARTVLGFQF